MNIITDSTVEVVGVTQFLEHPRYKVPVARSSADALCAFAAKGCYDSFGEEGRACAINQREVIASGHGSVLEHFNVSLFIEGISRACSHEIVRHRSGFAYSQRSTRYTKEEDAAIVLEPYFADIYRREKQMFPFAGEVSAEERTLLHGHLNAIDFTFKAYPDQVERLVALNPYDLEGFALRKWARGKARNVLSHALETRMTMTGNLRSWRHFIEMRSSRHAEPEIRRLTQHVFEAIQPWAPTHFEDYEPVMVDGFPEYTTPHRKV